MSSIAPILAAGLVAGSLYALVASGLSFVWGTVRIFNFAQGAMLMLGAYVAWYVTDPSRAGLGLAAGISVAVVVLALGGAVLYLAIVQPFIGKQGADLLVIMTTLAAATFFENGALRTAGPRYKNLPHLANGNIQFFNTAISAQELIIIIVGPSLLLAFAVFLKRSKLGMAIRAVEQNRDTAFLVGINISRIYVIVFAISAALAAIAGILYGGEFFITPTMGDDPLLKGFIVVVFGGLGSLPGTVVGAYVIALIEAVSSYYIGLYYTPPVLFAILITVILVRPSGLMGRPD
jgi:branched-chain amino acid transport system permease protein